MKHLFFILFIISTSSMFLLNCSTKENESAKVIHTKSCTIAIEGMMCEKGCKTTIQNKLREMDGVINCDVDFELQKAFITYDANIVSAEDFIQTINNIADGDLYKSKIIEDKDIENLPSEVDQSTNDESISVSFYNFETPDLGVSFYELIL